MRIRTLILGGAIGAAVAYLLDPVSGEGRRRRLRDQATSKMRQTREEIDRASHGTQGQVDASPAGVVGSASGSGADASSSPTTER